MPTYEYECQACGHRFDEFQSMKDDPLTKCPECKKKKLKRLFGTGAALLFKGDGFYITDYRSDSYKAAAKADKEAGGGGGKSEGTRSETGKAADSGKGKSSGESSKSKSKKADD